MKKLYLSAVVSAVLAACSAAQASVLTFDSNYVFSGTAPASLVTPWLTTTFEDVTGGVKLTMTATHLTGTEYVSSWYINLDPTMNPANLSFSDATHVNGSFDDPSISQKANEYKPDGDGDFDVLFSFATSDGANTRFGAGDSISYTISGITGLNANSFAYTSAGLKGGYYTAAHIQAIGADSGWIAAPVPEPGTIVAALSVLGPAGLIFRRRK